MKKCISLLLVLLLLLSFAGCAGESASEDESSGTVTEADPGGTHTVTDHKGNQVEVPNTIDRIVVCDIYPLPSIISVFFDSAEKLVGIPAQSMTAAKNSLLSELYPDILKAETGYIDGTNLNAEELLKLEPDVVFYNAGNAASEEIIRQLGLPGIAISAGKWQYEPFETLEGWIQTLDDVFNGNEHFARLKVYAENVLSEVNGRLSGLTGEEKKSVFFLFQYSDSIRLSAGNPSFGSEWCRLFGGDYTVKEKTEQNSLPVTMEQIYVWDPDVIFITNFTSAMPEELYENKIGNDDWSPIGAVKEKRVYKLPMGLYRSYTAGADAPLALLYMAKAVYPERFQDMDLIKETVKYYQEVFDVTISEEQAKKIMVSP